ncbi:MAG: hypothetical protein PHY93_19010 [Bacteriovorax sp.]|nr:hypothetical protein [Bacteriovorax sp.]
MRVLKLFLLIALINAPQAFSCGDYLIQAEVVMKNGVSFLVINPGSESEINLKVAFKETPKLAPYIGRFIQTKIKIERPMDATRGEVASIEGIKVLVPDPLLSGKGTSMKMIKSMDCKPK